MVGASTRMTPGEGGRGCLLGAHAVLFFGSFHAPPPTGPTINKNYIFQDGIHIHTHVYTYIYVARDGHGQ